MENTWIFDLDNTLHDAQKKIFPVINQKINQYICETVKINLQIKCEALSDDRQRNVSYYLYPRSSIIKTPLRLSNSVGIIDAGYRGDIIAYVDNIKNKSYTISQGDRLFQICAGNLEPIEFQLVNDLSNTQRGTSGFGSTGL